MGKVRDLPRASRRRAGGGAHPGVAQLVEAQLLRTDGVDDTRVFAGALAPFDEQRGDPDRRAPGAERAPRQHREVGSRGSVVAASSCARRRVSRSSSSPLRPPACGANSTGGMCSATCSHGAANRSTRRSASSSGAITALVSVVGVGRGPGERLQQPVAVGELLLDRLVVGLDGLQVVEATTSSAAIGWSYGSRRTVGHRAWRDRCALPAPASPRRVGHARARVQVEEQAVGGPVGGCALDSRVPPSRPACCR